MSSAESERAEDQAMGRTYALVLLCHTAVIAALWIVGRTFSS
jgi:hypothetical protein